MGIHASPATVLGRVPTYYITDILREDAGGGNVRVWNYSRKNGVLVPEFECIMIATHLLTVGHDLSEFAQAVFNATNIRAPGMKVH